ncbi:hypothetical protein Tsubulata_017746 [Turnera subulata]|uniref:Mitochondrial acidic protein MAM33 n=1 Tax=Turnera subulata TaxID=218843 RepID=A0A9Q0GJU9_9ROSI|nr:hypothetical protein Tsubulata_017746 [Turnera subulata]
MWRRALTQGGLLLARQPWRAMPTTRHSSTSASLAAAVDNFILRSLKDHHVEVSKMNPPPVNPPSPFTIVKGSLDSNGPVLSRTFGNEEISISVMRLASIVPGGEGEEDEDDINQLFLHVDVSKPGQQKSLHFLCGLYPDALGIHSVALRSKLDNSTLIDVPSSYNGPVFGELDERMRDAFHSFVSERGVNEDLFPFLQAWLYVKENRGLMRWFKKITALSLRLSLFLLCKM